MPAKDPTERRLLAEHSNLIGWAETVDRTARTQAARDAQRQNYLTRVDEWAQSAGVVLTPEDRERRADQLWLADQKLRSAKAAAARRKLREEREALQRTDVENRATK